VKLSEYYIKNMVVANDPSTAGTLLHVLVALCFFDLIGTSFHTIPCFANIPEIIKETINIKSMIKLNEFSNIKLSQLISPSSGNLILPKHYAGPDIMYFSDSGLFLVGNKTTQQKRQSGTSKSVDTRKVISNYNTTDLANLFGNTTDEKKLEEKKEIYHNLIAHPPQVIIRIHIILPTPARSVSAVTINTTNVIRLARDNFVFTPPKQEHKDKKRKTSPTTGQPIEEQEMKLNVPTYVVNLDTHHLDSCGLFSKDVATTLKKIYIPPPKREEKKKARKSNKPLQQDDSDHSYLVKKEEELEKAQINIQEKGPHKKRTRDSKTNESVEESNEETKKINTRGKTESVKKRRVKGKIIRGKTKSVQESRLCHKKREKKSSGENNE